MLRMRSMLRRSSVTTEAANAAPTAPAVGGDRDGTPGPGAGTPILSVRAKDLDISTLIEDASPIPVSAQDADVALLAPTPAPISEAVSGREDADFELEIFVEES